MRLMKFKDEMTPWRAVALWGKEELERLGYSVRLGHVSAERDTWYVAVEALGLEVRCDGQDFRLCRLSPGSRATVAIYEYDDPGCFDACLADLERHVRQRQEQWSMMSTSRWP